MQVCLMPLCLTSYRSVVVPVKKPPPGSLSVNTVGTPTTSGAATAGSTPNIFAAATATPKSMINTTGERERTDTAPLLLDVFTHINGCTASIQCAFKVRQQTDTCSMTKVFG